MELDFDKEIDALLRNAENSTAAFTAADSQFQIRTPHLDADEISAFAENALPVKARQSFILHLADCDGCRKILSNLILLNSEAGPAAASAVTAPAFIGENIPWYRKLFLFPNLAYVMGSLVLVFTGFLGYMVLQNSGGSANSEVSQIADSQTAPGAPGFSERSANANTMSLSSNAMRNTNAAVSVPNSANSAANAAKPESPTLAANTATDNGAVSVGKNFVLDGADAMAGAPAAMTPPAAKENQKSEEADKITPSENESKTDAQITQSQNPVSEMNSLQSGISRVPAVPSKDAKATAEKDRSDTRMSGDSSVRSKRSARLESTNSSNRKQVGGRTFELKQGVWYDSAYRGQATFNVRRGTGEYRMLDSGLRSIAESFAGIVVAVWKDKAYRFQ